MAARRGSACSTVVRPGGRRAKASSSTCRAEPRRYWGSSGKAGFASDWKSWSGPDRRLPHCPLRLDNPLPIAAHLNEPHPHLEENLLEHLTLLGGEIAAG